MLLHSNQDGAELHPPVSCDPCGEISGFPASYTLDCFWRLGRADHAAVSPAHAGGRHMCKRCSVHA